MKYFLLPMILMSLSLSFPTAQASTGKVKNCSTLLKKVSPFLHKHKAQDLEVQFSLAIHRILTAKDGMLIYGAIPMEPVKDYFNFTTGSRKYAEEVLARLDWSQKEKIISLLYGAYINHFIPRSDNLTEADWGFNSQEIHGPWLDRLMNGRQKQNILTSIFATRKEKRLRKFVEEHIDSFIANGIAMTVVDYPRWFQLAISSCVGVYCSRLIEGDPTILFSVLAAIPARELLRKDRPFIFGFESDFDHWPN